jgi:hypothetical protein
VQIVRTALNAHSKSRYKKTASKNANRRACNSESVDLIRKRLVEFHTNTSGDDSLDIQLALSLSRGTEAPQSTVSRGVAPCSVLPAAPSNSRCCLGKCCCSSPNSSYKLGGEKERSNFDVTHNNECSIARTLCMMLLWGGRSLVPLSAGRLMRKRLR